MDNLIIYERVRAVPQEAQKKIFGGRMAGKTDINPMWRIKTLTENFGVCGIGWKAPVKKFWLEPGANGEIAAFCEIELFIKVDGAWSDGITGIGGSSFVANEKNGLYTSDECYKMAYTDAISVACKMLGVGADIYWDKDATKYDNAPTTPPVIVLGEKQEVKPIKCEVCSKDIENTETKSVFQVSQGTKKHTGKSMCLPCFKKWESEQHTEAKNV